MYGVHSTIRLFFSEDSAFAIHSLARNAEEILSCLLKVRREKSLWTEMMDRVKPEYQKIIRAEVDGVRNSLKHKVFKENELIELPLSVNEYFLFICVNALHQHWPKVFKGNKNFNVFNLWFRLQNPDISPPELKERLSKMGVFTDKGLTRAVFYEKYSKLADSFSKL